MLTDVVMPEWAAWNWPRGCKSPGPELKVIYMSGYAEGDKLQPGLGKSNASSCRNHFPPRA